VTPLRILAALADKSACGYYRLQLPLATLKAQGLAEVTLEGMHDARDYDIIIGQRVSNEQPTKEWQQLAAHKNRNYRLVFEIDDDLWNCERSNKPAWDYYACDRERLRRMQRNIEVSDLVTTTTEFLADELRKRTDAPVVVLPNYVDAALLNFTPERPSDLADKFVVGCGGSPSHLGDWQYAGKGIGRFFKQNPETVMYFLGAEFTRQLPESVWPQIYYTQWQPSTHQYYAKLSMDVGLAPLRPGLFNASKSNLKALEYAALGIPAVCTAYTPYESFVDDEVTGFLVYRDDQWASRLRDLYENDDMRLKMGDAARELAKKHTIQEHAHKWADAYRSVL
jgi:glycosyltransferase involved in cell wall biosynthesis